MGILSNADKRGAVNLIWLKRIGLVVAFASLWVVSAAVAQLVINPPVSNVNINGHTYTNSMLQSNPAGWLAGVANDIGQITAAYPQGRFSPRVRLTAALDMYVDAAGGSDSNNCLTGNPCSSVQRPFDILRDGYDLAGNVVTVHLADGSYSPGLKLQTKLLGQHGHDNLILVGNEAAPANVIIADTGLIPTALDSGVGSPIFVAYGGTLSVRGVTLVSGFRSAWAHVSGDLLLRNIRFGSAGQCHVAASTAALIRFDGDYSIFAGTNGHYCAYNGGTIIAFDPANPQRTVHVSISNNPVFAVFAISEGLSQVYATSAVTAYTGTASGARYGVATNSIVDTAGSGASFLPGSLPGALATGGVYR